jgi:hypothetical protein
MSDNTTAIRLIEALKHTSKLNGVSLLIHESNISLLKHNLKESKWLFDFHRIGPSTFVIKQAVGEGGNDE